MQLEQDMGLASDVARQAQTPRPLGEAARDIYNSVVEKQPQLAKKDFSSVYRFLKDQQR
jgi:3-hydroxyisobutyrate dehydrogenase